MSKLNRFFAITLLLVTSTLVFSQAMYTDLTVGNLTLGSETGLLNASSGSVSSVANGTEGQLLTFSSGQPMWQDAPVSTTLSLKGDIQTHDGTDNAALSVGTDGQILSSNSGEVTGLEWIDLPVSTTLTTKGDLQGFDGTDNVAVGVGTDGQVLTADSSAPAGVSYQDASVTLQDAYDNSANGNLLLNSTIGQFNIRNGDPFQTEDLSGDLFSVTDFSGVNSYFNVNADGAGFGVLAEIGKDAEPTPAEFIKLGDKHIYHSSNAPSSFPYRDAEVGSIAMSDSGLYTKYSNVDDTYWTEVLTEQSIPEYIGEASNVLSPADSSYEPPGAAFTGDVTTDGTAIVARIAKTQNIAHYDKYESQLLLISGTTATYTKTITNSSYEGQGVLLGCQAITGTEGETYTLRIDGEDVYSGTLVADQRYHDLYFPFVGGSTDYEIEVTTTAVGVDDEFRTRVDNCFLGARPKEHIQELTYENSTEIDLTGSGDFTGGRIAVERVGNQVTVGIKDNLTFTSSTSAKSALNALPSWAIPTKPMINVFAEDDHRIIIRTDGSIETIFPMARTFIDIATASYIAAEKKSSAHIVQQNNELTAKTANEFGARVSSAGIVSNEEFDFIDSISLSNSVYSITLTSGRFSSPPNCTASPDERGYQVGVNVVSKDSVIVGMANSGGTPTDHGFTIECRRSGDYNKSQIIQGSFEQIRSDALIKVYLDSAASLSPSDATWVSVNWDSEQQDTSSSFDLSTNTFTSPRATCYSVSGGAQFNDPASDTVRMARIYVTGASGNREYRGTRTKQDTFGNTTVSVSSICLAEGDTMQLEVFTSPANTMPGGGTGNHLTITELPDYQSIVANLNKNKNIECQRKYLSASATSTGVMSDVTFNNLDTSKYYSLDSSFEVKDFDSVSSDRYAYIEVEGFENLPKSLWYARVRNAEGLRLTLAPSFSMEKPTGTTLSFNLVSLSNVEVVLGSWVELCELPDNYIETNKFN